VGLAIAIRPDEGGGGTPAAPVSDAEAAAIVEQRCAPCHSQSPTQEGYESPPGGVVLETRDEIVDRADEIREQAVLTQAMPLGNVTGMTEQEREELGAWLDGLE
jgi:uncharacterized membrane protein